MYARYAKRPLDFIFALLLLIILSPLLFLLAVIVRISLGSGILFTQRRPGAHGQTFELLKFRTMTNATNAEGKLLEDEVRITRVGQFLRETSLDELPSLVNVLRGQMSFVGPRPLLMKYLPLYTVVQNRRHEVKPGITGWAQANGRNSLSWTEKFELDVWYVDNVSLRMDLRILIMTVAAVVRRADVATPGFATAPEFNGKN